MKTLRKVLIAVGGVILVVFLMFTINYVKNEIMIYKTSKGTVTFKDMPPFSFISPYIYHYNKGNLYYIEGDYDMAYLEYKKSLKQYIPKGKECDVRVNAALSIVTPLPLDNVNDSNIDEILDSLYEARDILTEKGCADAQEETGGHYDDAQTLKNEIQELIDELENYQNQSNQNNSGNNNNQNNNNNNGGGSGDNNDPSGGGSNPPGENGGGNNNSGDNSEPTIEEQLEELQRGSMEDRTKNVDMAEYMDNYEYYSGKPW